MALREYIQDLVRTQAGCDDGESSTSFLTISVIDDNCLSSLPENDLASDNGKLPLRNFRDGEGPIACVQDEHREEVRADDNQTILDDFRRRKRFLQQTLSPKRVCEPASPIFEFSPVPVTSQITPSPTNSDTNFGCDVGIIGKDKQRCRIAQLRRSFRHQRKTPCPPLL